MLPRPFARECTREHASALSRLPDSFAREPRFISLARAIVNPFSCFATLRLVSRLAHLARLATSPPRPASPLAIGHRINEIDEARRPASEPKRDNSDRPVGRETDNVRYLYGPRYERGKNRTSVRGRTPKVGPTCQRERKVDAPDEENTKRTRIPLGDAHSAINTPVPVVSSRSSRNGDPRAKLRVFFYRNSNQEVQTRKRATR